MSDEQWRPVSGYEGRYEVSSLGRVRSLPRLDSAGRRVRGGYLSINTNPSGHKQVKLSRDGRYRQGKLHRLVLTAFAGPQPDGCEALHDSVRHGTHHWANKTHCPQLHPYDSTNTYVTSNGKRMCRECLRTRTRQRRARLAMEAAA